MLESTDFSFEDELSTYIRPPISNSPVRMPLSALRKTYEAGRDMLFTGVVMRHGGSWHDFAVYSVKEGRVTWRCRSCGKVESKQVRVYGVMPADLLFVRKDKHYGQAVERLRQVD